MQRPSALNAQSLVGKAAADALFPVNSPIQEPTQPNGQSTPRFDFGELPPPGEPDSQAILARDVRRHLLVALKPPEKDEPSDAVGSNNWAVGPSRSSTGNAILAGDPHLDLTLPSVWYEMHIVVPGKLDAAGAGFPGMPGVVIGFNRDVAWTFTNTGLRRQMTTTRKRSTTTLVRHAMKWTGDGAIWRSELETYRNQAGDVIATDTLYFTHRGPMRKLVGKWLSMRWTAYEPSREPDNFLALSRTTSVNEWLYAMRDYVLPRLRTVSSQTGAATLRFVLLAPIRFGPATDEET